MRKDEDQIAKTEATDLSTASSLAEVPRPFLAVQTRATGRPDEADLATIRRVLAGDVNAYRTIVERYQRRVSTIMWRFSRDREVHRELVQEVFIQAYEGLSKYRAEAPFEHWLAKIATRVGYRYWKRERRAPETVSLEEWQELRASAEAMEPQAAGQALYALLSRLPPRDRLVLTLRYIEDRTVEETAQLTGWSETMVKVQAWRARRKLKTLFEQIEASTSA